MEAGQRDIIDAIKQWVRPKEQVIHRIFEQKGGWEGWMQVEVALFLASMFPNINVRREENIYRNNPNLRADIFLSDPMGYQIIELKCESLFQDLAGVKKFASTFKEDLEKVHHAQLKSEYCGKTARIWCVGITCDPNVRDATRHFNWAPYNVDDEEVVPNVYIWYSWRDVN